MSPKQETIERLKEQIESKPEDAEDALITELDEKEDRDAEEEVEEGDAAGAEVGAEPEGEEAAEQRSSTREYVILEQGDSDKTWVVIDRKEAASTESALRSLGDDLTDGSMYVAVPTRSWSPVSVNVKKATTISFT